MMKQPTGIYALSFKTGSAIRKICNNCIIIFEQPGIIYTDNLSVELD